MMYIKNKLKSVLKRFINFFNTDNVKAENWNPDLNQFLVMLKGIGYYPEVILDIGANKGNWTRSANSVFPDAYIVMFEPQSELNIYLSDLIRKSNIKLVNKGVGSSTAKHYMSKVGRHDSATFRELNSGIKEVEKFEVDVITLDEFISESKIKPNIIKIDAEGMDLEVLKGASFSLRSCEIILVEASVAADFDNSVFKVLEFMSDMGYKLFDITDLNRLHNTGCLVLVELAFIRIGSGLDLMLTTKDDYFKVVNNVKNK
jgi:FkbM family methyltransferase